MRTILITGAAGFIGSNLSDTLLKLGYKVVGVDNFDDFYPPDIKRRNIAQALGHNNYSFFDSDICHTDYLLSVLPSNIEAIIHLAAKAGVRSSIFFPAGYEENNTTGITKALELSVKLHIPKFIFASSSSIYGNINTIPFREDAENLNPLNPYAKSKLISEQIGRNFSQKNNIRFISLRLFSVYGPRLRPDLIMTKIAQCMLNNQPLQILGKGDALRDFTYIDDIISGIIKSLAYSEKSFDIFNLGFGDPVSLNDTIKLFEKISGKEIKLEFTDKVQGESNMTWADISKAKQILGFKPSTDLQSGISRYLAWFNKENE